MTESTARAERFDLQPAPSPLYLWEVPQKPVSVRIPFSLIDRLEREAVESFRSLTSRGSEIGGLLVGRRLAGKSAGGFDRGLRLDLVRLQPWPAVPVE